MQLPQISLVTLLLFYFPLINSQSSFAQIRTAKNGSAVFLNPTSLPITICLPRSENGRCGMHFGSRCGEGECCSSFGFCGSGKEWCEKGNCQTPFGNCELKPDDCIIVATATTTSTISTSVDCLSSVSSTHWIRE